MSTTTQELSKTLADRYHLTTVVRSARSNPNMNDMPAGSTHWLIILNKTEENSFSVPFSQGPRCEGSPTLYDVLTCLAADARMLDSGEFDSFDAYADAFGIDTDSRKAERGYQRMVAAITKQTDALKLLLGDRLFALLLNDEDVQ